MDSTVISDTVNTASRLEQLTKRHKRDILISSELVKGLRDTGRFSLSRLGHEQVKGKTQTIEVYSLDGAAGDQYLWRAAPASGKITI
jgi:class 3 adenylate cyclase